MIRTLWDRAVEKIEEISRERKLKSLHLAAEQDLVKSQQRVVDAETALDAAVMKQRDAEKPNFEAILKAKRELRIADKEFQIDLETFEEFFGEKPRYVSI